MKEFVFKKIDAFATRNSDGNPAAGIYLDSPQDISEDDMQRIARELKGFVSEVGYVAQLDEDTVHLRYFSSEREVAFCGHATIGIIYDLIKQNQKLLTKNHINIVTNKGTLLAENRIQTEDAVFITAPKPHTTPVDLPIAEIAGALNIRAEAIPADTPISVINAGLETLLVPIQRLEVIFTIAPEIEYLKQFCLDHSIDIVTVFCDEVAHPANALRTRVFAPTFGYLEDPATGTGNAALGYHLIQHKKWDGSVISIEQNGNQKRPNRINLMTKTDEQNNLQVLFGGGAIVRIDGTYRLA